MRALTVVVLCVWSLSVAAAENGHGGHGDSAPGGSASAAPVWTDLPLIEMAPGRDRAAATFRLRNLSVDTVKAYAPGDRAPLPEGLRFKTDRLEWDITAQDGRFTLQSSGVGNYHWLQARQESTDGVTVASTAHFFSNPGPAPTDLLDRPKSELEIVPAPLPREHNQYRENQKRFFMLRFQGKPLAGTTLRFVSDAGTRASFVSDAAGRVLVNFPADVKPAEGQGGHGQPAANRFVLAVEHEAQGRHYLTAFNYRYGADAYARRSLLWGGGFLALGGLLGLPLIMRRKEPTHA